jgi:hypothetical protein
MSTLDVPDRDNELIGIPYRKGKRVQDFLIPDISSSAACWAR